ncbi:MAG: hypothetical protein BWY59_01492 [Verrucomicrobia bacterium ADurb.Bin345]|nr:MAG: hypothetical protein BWY59_01492 [Verrucomicrobia bacterium ADurb.Bin345]
MGREIFRDVPPGAAAQQHRDHELRVRAEDVRPRAGTDGFERSVVRQQVLILDQPINPILGDDGIGDHAARRCKDHRAVGPLNGFGVFRGGGQAHPHVRAEGVIAGGEKAGHAVLRGEVGLRVLAVVDEGQDRQGTQGEQRQRPQDLVIGADITDSDINGLAATCLIFGQFVFEAIPDLQTVLAAHGRFEKTPEHSEQVFRPELLEVITGISFSTLHVDFPEELCPFRIVEDAVILLVEQFLNLCTEVLSHLLRVILERAENGGVGPAQQAVVQEWNEILVATHGSVRVDAGPCHHAAKACAAEFVLGNHVFDGFQCQHHPRHGERSVVGRSGQAIKLGEFRFGRDEMHMRVIAFALVNLQQEQEIGRDLRSRSVHAASPRDVAIGINPDMVQRKPGIGIHAHAGLRVVRDVLQNGDEIEVLFGKLRRRLSCRRGGVRPRRNQTHSEQADSQPRNPPEREFHVPSTEPIL